MLVDRCVRLIDARVGSSREVGLQLLGDVPADAGLSEPGELLAIGHRYLVVRLIGIDIAQLLFIVAAVPVARHRNAVGQPVELEVAYQFRLCLAILSNQLERLKIRVPVVVEACLIHIVALILGCWVFRLLEVLRITHREIGRIPRHRVLGLDVEAHSAERHRAHLVDGLYHVAYRVTLGLCTERFESLIEFHVLIVRVIFRCAYGLGTAVVERSRELELFRQPFAKVGLSRNRVFPVVVELTFSR